MVSETVEFIVEFFDDVFHAVLHQTDARIEALKKYCNTLTNMRHKRMKTGSVIATVQVMDSLKYLEPSFHTLLKRIENGEIKLHDDAGNEICDIVIAAFGETNSGWRGSMSEFTGIMGDNEENVTKNYRPGSDSFYLRTIPESIIKHKEGVEFLIFGVLIKSDTDGYDRCAINVIGLPNERKEEIHNQNVLEMFGYRK